MALNLGTLNAYINADTSNFDKGVDSADSKWGKLGSSLASVGKTIAGTVAAAGLATIAVGGTAVTSLIKTGIAYNDLEQKSKAAFTTILGSADAAAQMMGQIREFGKTSPFPRQAFISATQQMLGFGFAAEDIIPTLKVINDTTAAVGGNADTIATLTDVFAKIKSQGKITGEELNRLGSIGVNAVDMLAQHAGVSGDEIRKSISKGAIDADTAISVLTEGMGQKFGGASENVKATWSGAVDRVKGAWRDLGSALAEPFVAKGGGGLAVEWANTLADKIRVLEKQAPAAVEAIMAKVSEFVAGFRDGIDEIGSSQSRWAQWGAIAYDVLTRVHDGARGLYDLLFRGDYTGALGRALGIEEDSGLVSFLLGMRDAVLAVVQGLRDADLSKSGSAFASIGASLKELTPAFQAFGRELPSSASVVGILATALGQIASIALFLASHMKLLLGAFIAYRIGVAAASTTLSILRVQQLLNTATTIRGMAVTQAQTVALRAHTIALQQQIAAQRGVTLATVQAEAAAAGDAAMQKRSLAARVAARVGTMAMAAATGIATAAQWAFNAALAAPLLPILAVVAGIALLVGAVVLLWKHNAGFRDLVTRAWGAIKDAVAGAVGWITGTAWPALQAAWTAISDGVGAAVGFIREHWSQIGTVLLGPVVAVVAAVVSHWAGITDGFWGVVHGIGDAVASFLAFLAPVGAAIAAPFVAVGQVVKEIWDGWIFPVFDLMGAIITTVVGAAWTWLADTVTSVWKTISGAVSSAWGWVRDTVLIPAVTFITGVLVAAWTTYVDAVTLVWNTIKGAVQSAWNWVRDTVLIPLGAFVTIVAVAYWTTLRDGVITAWNAVKQPVMDAWVWMRDYVFKPIGSFVTVTVPGYWTTGVGYIGDAWGLVSGKLSSVWESVKSTVWNPIQQFMTVTVPGYFTSAVDMIGTAWDAIRDTAKKPIRWVIDTVINDGIVGTFNKIASKFPGVKNMETVPLPQGFARGTEDHRAEIARGGAMRVWAEPETGGEAYIPLAQSKRNRSTGILANVAERFGYQLHQFADGGLVDLGHQLQSKGFRVSEHPAFGGVHPVHANGSQHYVNNALDVNLAGTSGTSAKEQAAIDAIVGSIKSQGFPVLWRVKDHFNHMHISGRKGVLGQVGDLVSGAVDSVSSFLSPLSDLVEQLLPDTASEFGPVGDVAAGMGRKVAGLATDALKSAASAVGDALGGGSSGADVGEYDGAQGKLSPAQARAAAKSMLPAGWDWGALDKLWQGESGWSWSADNPTSSAYGIPQALPGSKMAASGSDWATNAITQIKWGMNYIKGRKDYGTSQAAYAKWLSRDPHWYDTGGWLGEGTSLVHNGTGGPEPVLTVPQLSALQANAEAVGRMLTENATGAGRGDTHVSVEVQARVESVTDAAAVGRMIGFELGKVN